MFELMPSQEDLFPHLSKEDYQHLLDETRKLEVENAALKERIKHLEYQIVTHAYGGWQTH